MFFTSSKKTIVFAVTLIALLAADLQIIDAKQHPIGYDAPPAPSRLAQIQNARRRAQVRTAHSAAPRINSQQIRPATNSARNRQSVRIAQNTNQRAPVAQTRATSRAQVQPTQATRIVGGPRPNTGSYMPQHLRTAQLLGSPVVGGGSPIVQNSVLETPTQGDLVSYGATTSPAPFAAAPLAAPAAITPGSVVGSPIVGGQIINGGHIIGGGEIVSGGEIIGDGGCGGACGGGSCGGGSCGVGESYFDSCDSCAYSNGGCPPDSVGNCWMWGLGKILRRGEVFVGTTAFRAPGYTITDAAGGTTNVNDASFGFYGGANYGIPLCRLTCGFLSGQIGIRSVQTEFDDTSLTNDSRDQLFVTAGLYRRVDYGLQAGLVVDYLQEEWFGNSGIAQIRGDVSWVYGPSALGFRFTSAQEDDFTEGSVNGSTFDNVLTEALDQYRFYHRTNINSGGFMDLYAGWSEDDHAVFGAEADIPMGSIFAMQSGFTYLLPNDDLPVLNDDAWNLYMGIAIRPRGRQYYGDYDRPLLPVADNGSFITRRTSN